MELHKSIFDLADKYDTFIVDVYGVLFDGVVMYEYALRTLEKLREIGKQIIILSNTTQIAEEAKNGYANRGMFADEHYDVFLTSGEYLRHVILNDFNRFVERVGHDVKTVKCLFMGNNNIFADTCLQKVEHYEDADVLYIGVPRASYGAVRLDDVFDEEGNAVSIENVLCADWSKLKDSSGRTGLLEFARQLQVCLDKNKTILVANPDIFAHSGVDNSSKKVPVVTQGSLGRYYQSMGGNVANFGKPFSDIFEYAKSFSKSNRIAMIGDTPWTDIAGANNAGIDSILVKTGVTGEFIKRTALYNKDQSLLFDELFGSISAKLIYGNLNYQYCMPNYIVDKMA